MALSTTHAYKQWNGNGSTTEFPIDFQFGTSAELVVTLISALGVETVKTISTHYTIAGGQDANGNPATGTLTMLTAPASGEKLRVDRATLLTQTTQHTSNDAFPPKVVEAAYDRARMVEQENRLLGRRAIKQSLQDYIAGGTAEISFPAPEAGSYIRWNGDGDALENAEFGAASAAVVDFLQGGSGAAPRNAQDKLRERVTTADFTDNSISAAVTRAAAVDAPAELTGDYEITSSLALFGRVRGHGVVNIERVSGTDPAITIDAPAVVENLAIDNQASDGNRSGHVIRATASDVVLRNLLLTDFGSMGDGGGGTGVLVFDDGDGRPQRPRLFDTRIKGNDGASAAISVGWLFGDTDYGFAGHLLVESIEGSAGIGYAHELKDNAKWNNLHALTAVGVEHGFAYGQEGKAPGEGASFNVLVGLLSKSVDRGQISGKTVGNLTVGALTHADDRPGETAQSYAVHLNDAQKEAHYALLNFGAGADARAVVIDGVSSCNFVQVANHAEGTTFVRILDTARSNVVEVTHPGEAISILDTVNDSSGAPSHGDGANVVYCHATGEYLGTISGRFRWYLGNPGAAHTAAHRFQMARDGNVILSFGTPGDADSQAGIAHASPSNGNAGLFYHNLKASEDQNTWRMAGFGLGTDRYIWEKDAFRPAVDAAVALGSDTFAFSKITLKAAASVARFVNSADSADVEVASFEGDRATMADNDRAHFLLKLSGDDGNQASFARISWRADDVNVGTGLDGSLFLGIMVGNNMTDRLRLQSANLTPAANDGTALGSSVNGFSDLFLAAGGELRLNNVQLLDTVGGLSTQTALATAIAAIGNAINTANKRAGKMVFDTTNNRLMIATGSAAADAWKSADGGTTVSPA